MARHTLNRVLRRSALTVALGLSFSSTLYAQSSTGSLYGQAEPGQVVLVENAATGFRREVPVSSEGTFRLSSLSPGTYRVGLRDGSNTSTVNVNVGTGTPVNLTARASSGTTDLEGVVVRGVATINPIDVSSVESTTVLTAEQIARVPVARDATSVALLAPGTVRGDSAFGNLASFGGSSVAENQYYVNGFNITNSFKSLNFSKIPFEALAEQQVKTGGYGAEFGRSLGGVVNQVTKRGTNVFQAGANVFWEPASLASPPRNTYYANPLTGEFGTLRSDNSKDETDKWVTTAWAGGALVQDKLFAFATVSYGETQADAWGSVLSNQNTRTDTDDPIWLVKLDWNINEQHTLEFTAFSDKSETEQVAYSNNLGVLNREDVIGTFFSETGGENYIFNYTGYLTDSFNLSALYGRSTFTRSQYLMYPDGTRVSYGGDLDAPATGCPIIVDARPLAVRQATGEYFSTCNITGAAIGSENAEDKREQFRIDAEWTLGDHLLRFGYDHDNYQSVDGSSFEGGRIWRYDVSPAGANRVREQIVNQGATVEVKQDAFYIEDNWSVTDRFLAYIGLRWDSFDNLNGDGDSYVKIERQFAPRLGFSWDANGDSSLKIYGNAGRYALPLTASVAIRGASASLFSRQFYSYTGVDPVTGAPIGAVPISAVQYINGEFGGSKDPKTIASQNLDPMYQDEYILGFQQQLTDHLNYEVKGTFRKLKAAIDDNCDYTPVTDAADAAGLDYILPNGGFPYCRMFNPGEDAVYVTDLLGDGNYTTVTIPGDFLSPQAKRSYKALDFRLNGTWEKFFMTAAYTLAYSKGNTEGGVKSDIGQDDTNVTQDFDYKELTVDTEGYLPNDRRHTFKAFGSYAFNEEWSVGANVLVQSGRPINCLGVLDLDPGPGFSPHPYGSSFMRCGTTEAGGVDDATVIAVPRGTAGRLPWTRSLDLNVAYSPAFVEGLRFKVDVFNVFNSQDVVSVIDQAENGTSGAPSPTYRLPTAFQPARTVRFMVQYDF